ncbi:MAG TPA: hypothetical protein VJN95_08610 [Gemmatimonadales bacterium]|nr:hypothetical protein [Gemmatimonadales bacterium]
MSPRRTYTADDQDVLAGRPAAADHGPLFDPPPPSPARSIAAGKKALDAAAAAREQLIAAMVPVARELGLKAGRHGIIPADVRLACEHRQICGKSADQRFYSFLPAVMTRAGGKPTDHTRPSFLASSHGKPQRVYVWTEAAA